MDANEAAILYSSTYEGQAHFAGTGPRGNVCVQCEYYNHPGFKADKSPKRWGSCRRAYEFGWKGKGKIPVAAASCKYFESKV